MFITKNGKFNHDLAVKFLQELQPFIREFASNNSLKAEVLKSDGTVKPLTFNSLPLDLVFTEEHKNIISKIAEGFLIANKLETNISKINIYSHLIKLLADEQFYLNENFNISNCKVFFNNLLVFLKQEISTTKVVLFNVIGASLNTGEVCTIGSVQFMNPQDFVESHKYVFDQLTESEHSAGWQTHIDRFKNCDLICKVKIKNRDTTTARILATEIIKRVYALARMFMPISNNKSNFFGSVGEEYLDSISSFLLSVDLNDENNIKEWEIQHTVNYFSNSKNNLLNIILPHQETDIPFTRIEAIITKFSNDAKLNEFETRIWTALYWYGEAIYERELNPIIIKYATCLEALFNSREGGISEQISEFTAHVVGAGSTKDERMKIYMHIKKLYSLRSNAVHGGSTVYRLDDGFLEYTRWICQSALFLMAYYCGQNYYQESNGYEKFIKYILKEYRFL